ncbi:hypothetical protein L9F63_026027, partial [Diploptera punctata]
FEGLSNFQRLPHFKILFFVWFDMVLLHSTPFNIFMVLRACTNLLSTSALQLPDSSIRFLTTFPGSLLNLFALQTLYLSLQQLNSINEHLL